MVTLVLREVAIRVPRVFLFVVFAAIAEPKRSLTSQAKVVYLHTLHFPLR